MQRVIARFFSGDLTSFVRGKMCENKDDNSKPAMIKIDECQVDPGIAKRVIDGEDDGSKSK